MKHRTIYIVLTAYAAKTSQQAEPRLQWCFAFPGNLYYRKDIETLRSFKRVRAPNDAREESTYEPDLIP